MINIVDSVLHYFGKKGEKLFFINIGAMDGVTFDDMAGYVSMYGFKGLYVEPVPHIFKKLKQNIDNDYHILENQAISDYEGTIKMMIIDPEPIESGIIHRCFEGMSAVYPPKNGLSSEGDRETVEKYSKIIEVPCTTFENLLQKHHIQTFDVISIDAEGHDFHIFKQIDFKKYRPKLIRVEWHSLSDEQKVEVLKIFEDNRYTYEITTGDNIDAMPNELLEEITNSQKVSEVSTSKVTIVTGIWDIKRDSLSEGWSRSFQHYLNHLEKLMKCPNNMIIYIEQQYEQFVKDRRDSSNTLIIVRELDWFKHNASFFEKIQEIRIKEEWRNQAEWLTHSTQANLEWYNPIVMSKMFLLNDAKILDPFNSSHLVWVDGALSSTVHDGYFWHDKVFNKISKYFNKFSFVAFPYDGKVEIHGFEYAKMCEYSGDYVDKVCRGGIFGGPKDVISQVNEVYHSILMDSLYNGFMGTEESIFTIMLYKYPKLFQYFEIESNGLLSTFFENLKNDVLYPKVQSKEQIKINPHNIHNVGLYVLTFNSPRQFETLCKSFEIYDRSFLDRPKKYVIDNSTDLSTDSEYERICKNYGFERIKKDNIGICGGRQFVAEHSEEQGFDYHFFFEDDMFFYVGEDNFCRNGFMRKIPEFYDKMMQVAWREDLDYLKWNFSEFFGDNQNQWAWHNVPGEVRARLFPENPVKTTSEHSAAPYTKFNNIKSWNGLPYATGEIYYCNWPQTVSREGNKKMFLNTKWARPYEQTWMSFIYQETVVGKISTGILLATPTEHNRFDHYDGKERKES